MENPWHHNKSYISTFFISFKKKHPHPPWGLCSFFEGTSLKNGGSTEFSQWKITTGMSQTSTNTPKSELCLDNRVWAPWEFLWGMQDTGIQWDAWDHNKFHNMSISMCIFCQSRIFCPFILGHKVWSANVAASQHIITLKWPINIHEPTCSRGPSGDVERFVPSAAAAAAVLYSAGYAAPGLVFAERWDVAAFPTSQR